jgi:hypothetical protein
MKKYTLLLIAVFAAAIFAVLMYTPAPVDAICLPTATAVPTSRNFITTTGDTSTTKIVTITNTSGVCHISGISFTFTGVDFDKFNFESNNCTATIDPGTSCEVGISFTPPAAGSFSAALHVEADNLDPADMVVLTGTDGSAATALLATLTSKDDSDGCNATASTGAVGKKAAGPAALGLVAMMGLVLGIVAVRRRTRKRG